MELLELEPWLPPPLVLDPPVPLKPLEPPPLPLLVALVAPDPWAVDPPVVPLLLAWRDPPVPLVSGGAVLLVDVLPLVLLGGVVVEEEGGLVELGGLVVVGGRVVAVEGGEVLVVVPWRFGAVALGGVAGAWARLEGGSVTLGDLVVGVPLVAGGAVDLELGGVLVAVASAACLGAVSKPTALPPIAPISTATRMLTHLRAAT